MGRFDIPQLSKGFFATVMPFRTEEGRNRYDYATFRRTMQEVLAAQEAQAGSRRIDFEIYEDAKYAMVALVDELAIVSDWAFRNDWAQEPLELAIFTSMVAGEEFFDRIQNLKKRYAAGRDEGERNTILGALEVFYTCLECGFKGRYRGESEAELGAVRSGLLGLLWPEGDQHRHQNLFPAAYGEGGKAEHRAQRMNMWPVLVAFILILAVGFYFGFSMLLGGKARNMERVVNDRAAEALATREVE
ncbi:MAG: DotU family type IV/VI secretion system protein [Planctomycetota bacterium]